MVLESGLPPELAATTDNLNISCITSETQGIKNYANFAFFSIIWLIFSRITEIFDNYRKL